MNWPSAKVRETFVQYFLRHPTFPHVHVPSSSIVPRNDPSLAFVNAGMNQFKDVILGLGRPKNPRVANSQKCLRINDLSLVGADTYHHTFFEMLGNWSFANYFKPEACFMAWDLLTNVYKLDPKRLYVTYYSGGNSLPVDNETKEIWKSLGIPKDRILPFGPENFWAMGAIGPCGPSTEIHYDHRGTQTETSEVNKDSGVVVEVWNLVFMQYNRTESGSLERLPLSHVVDTGAGLERLTAVLNNQVSNYDTDLFLPIFDTVQRLSRIPAYSGKFSSDCELDRGYRIFADHIRAITIGLSDGILPQTNHKIRKLIQRSLAVTENHFLPSTKSLSPDDTSAFLQESVKTVSSILSRMYKEIKEMETETGLILQAEVERFVEASKTNQSGHGLLPNLLMMDFPSLGRIKKSDLETIKSGGVLDGVLAYKLYESCGVTQEASEELCATLGVPFDKVGMNTEMAKMKKGFRDEVNKQMLRSSENNFVRPVEAFLSLQKPEAGGGICKPSLTISEETPVFIQWILDEDGNPVEEVSPDLLGEKTGLWVILNRTPFIPGGRTMSSDVGELILENGCILNVTEVKVLPSGWILHRVSNIPELGFSQKADVIGYKTDNAKLFGREISAQAIYGLQTWLHEKFKVVRFTDGFVSDNEIRLEFSILKGDFGQEEIQILQEDLNELGIPLTVTKRVLKKNGTYELACVTGVRAEIANRHGSEVVTLLETLDELCNNTSGDELVQTEIKAIRDELARCISDKDIEFPFEIYKRIQDNIVTVDKILSKNDEVDDINSITKSLMEFQAGEPFIVKCFDSDVEFSSLKKITRVVENKNKPVLVLICSSDGTVQGRCSLPEDASGKLSAEAWMACITTELGCGSVNPPKGQDPRVVANLTRIRVSDAHHKIQKGLEKAIEYINAHQLGHKQSKSSQIVGDSSS